LGLGWKPDVVHAHDWQTGLVPAFLEMLPSRPQRVFTIHNLAYGGHFSQADFTALHLPSHWWTAEGVEFYGGFSMLKAGIVYADAVTTVSPTYAREICTPAFGYGLDGLLQSRAYKLHGILNGIDEDIWNPATDPTLAAWYFSEQVDPGKSMNKRELLKRFGVDNPGAHLQAPLLGMVSRLVEQKGVDLVINAIPGLLADTDARFVLIGAGHAYFEQRLRELALQYPERVFVYIGYDEQLAHLLEAGADMFLMPSRFEPCGLNQMYSLRYGTPPIVFHTGGLADTVVDASEQNLAKKTANGFVFHEPSTRALSRTVRRALDCFAQPVVWETLQMVGMQQDFGWSRSAAHYLRLYSSHD
jgi:starch synthase